MSTVEHLVFLVNADGVRAKTAWKVIQTADKRTAMHAAKPASNFDLIERADSEHGYSDQTVALVRNGVEV
jgi:hypothetical protein